ncbi:FtsB family cell division protein [Solicola gregarius]|uniref:Septum formation initiator family protein n=1 Tax=Solicola gregarius TaxID=2908642 RepID=A0AA46TJN4_9ACTN|nr:septum formation initiator family protein [Solicola gregarius]UYM06501.1 septum formation initiator family protein [Solicola gregarius]
MTSKRRTPRSRPAGRAGAVRRVRAPAGPPDEEPQQSGGGSRLTGRAAVLFLVMLVLLISYASSLRAWLQQREDTAQARADIAAAQQSIDERELEKARLDDPAYVEKLARERFGWLRPGETGYTTLDENGDVLGGDGELTEPDGGDDSTGDDEQWYTTVWGSVQSAGEEPADQTADEPERKQKDKKPKIVRPRGMRQ